MLDALQVVTTVVVGLMVGVEFSVAFVVNPILDGLPGDGALHGRARGGRMLGTVMPFWYAGSLALVAVLALAGRQRGTALVAVSAGLLLVSVVMSVLLLVPINNRSRTWTAETAPADWRRQTDRWDRLHRVRVAVVVAAFALLVTALT
ncbi:anthrone oxygenase family protein [Streptomyces sp. NPDC101249]|uniref:anthrone oxygenase family protein n=1 Tax=unclassified Streptomyces TaxID=2593676 RepID=UPI0038134C64